MSGLLLPYIVPQYFDDNGAPLAGGKIYFYETGASTVPKTIYADRDLTVPLTNPYVLDAGGRMISATGSVGIYLAPGEYREVACDANDVPIWTKDHVAGASVPTSYVTNIAALKALDISNMSSGALVYVEGYATYGDGADGYFYYNSSSSATNNNGTVVQPTYGSGRWLRMFNGAVNVKWFGAKGDDTQNDTAYFTAAQACGAPTFVPNGRYKLSSDPMCESQPVIFDDFAIIHPYTAMNLTPVIDDMNQHFDITNAVPVFSRVTPTGYKTTAYPPIIYPEWFGIIPNSTDCAAAINAAIASAATWGGTVNLSAVYNIASSITLKTAANVVGIGGAVITQSAAGFVPISDGVAAITNVNIKDITILMYAGSTDLAMSLTGGPTNVVVDNVVSANGLSVSSPIRCSFRNNSFGALTVSGGSGDVWSDNTFTTANFVNGSNRRISKNVFTTVALTAQNYSFFSDNRLTTLTTSSLNNCVISSNCGITVTDSNSTVNFTDNIFGAVSLTSTVGTFTGNIFGAVALTSTVGTFTGNKVASLSQTTCTMVTKSNQPDTVNDDYVYELTGNLTQAGNSTVAIPYPSGLTNVTTRLICALWYDTTSHQAIPINYTQGGGGNTLNIRLDAGDNMTIFNGFALPNPATYYVALQKRTI